MVRGSKHGCRVIVGRSTFRGHRFQGRASSFQPNSPNIELPNPSGTVPHRPASRLRNQFKSPIGDGPGWHETLQHQSEWTHIPGSQVRSLRAHHRIGNPFIWIVFTSFGAF